MLTIVLSKKKKKISFILSTLTVKEKNITPANVFRTQKESQKTSVNFGKLYAINYN